MDMYPTPIDLAQARILVSNDDGISAPGLRVLERIARSLCADVWVVAPETEQSGASHSLTLHRPLRLRELGRRHFAVDGTPTDCVLLAMYEVMRDHPPNLILSGVNRGGNMGEDVSYSGTVAAAMEGTLLGVPSIALSLAVSHEVEPQWASVMAFAPDIIRRLATMPWPQQTLMNLNFPNVPAEEVSGVRAVAQGKRRIGDNLVRAQDPRGRPYFWIGPVRDEETAPDGTDIRVVADGAVAVTPICLDMTSGPVLGRLRNAFP